MSKNKLNLLKEKCDNFDPEDGEFDEIISLFLEVFDLPVRAIAGEFALAISTAERWRDGSVAPHGRTQEAVVDHLLGTITDKEKVFESSNIQDFLGLTDEEMAEVERRVEGLTQDD